MAAGQSHEAPRGRGTERIMTPRLTPGRRVYGGIDSIELPGDYFGPTNEHNAQDEIIGRGVWFILPIADPAAGKFGRSAHTREQYLATRMNGLHRVSETPWSFTEFPDGSLQIRESIACGRGDPEGEYWHGYLDAGHIWREV